MFFPSGGLFGPTFRIVFPLHHFRQLEIHESINTYAHVLSSGFWQNGMATAAYDTPWRVVLSCLLLEGTDGWHCYLNSTELREERMEREECVILGTD